MVNKLSILIFTSAIALSLLGIFVLYESSTYTAQLSIGDKYYFVRNQAIWFVAGAILCVVISKIDYRLYYKLALPLLVISLIFLVLVFLPGIGLELKGANRWINLGFIIVQPSELLKITLTIYLAAWLSVKEKGKFLPFIMLLSLSVFLVVAEPDMGTALIIAATSTIVYFLSGARILNMVVIFLAIVTFAGALIAAEPYRLARLSAYQNFDSSNLASTPYHIKQILIALGTGGAEGAGFGNSIQKYAYLPESTTDSIFAIFAEEAGFIGSTVLIGSFLLLVFLGYAIASQAPDIFGKLAAAGIITFIGIQAFVNIASQVVLIPLTGVPLPFISYGGSSLIINLVSIGILVNIASFKKGPKVSKSPNIKKFNLLKKL